MAAYLNAATIDLGSGVVADVNNAGTVVVSPALSLTPTSGFVRWLDGKKSSFPNGYYPSAINDQGVVAGLRLAGTNDTRVFRWSDSNANFAVESSEVVDFQIGSRSFPIAVNGINNSGTATGINQYRTPTTGEDQAGWTLSGSTIQGLFYYPSATSTYPYDRTEANAINGSGAVTGFSWDTSGIGSYNSYHGFVWAPGSGFNQLSNPTGSLNLGNSGTAGFGINDSGNVAGYAYTRYAPGGNVPTAAVWSNTSQPPQLLSPSGSVSSSATDINNSGQVVGFGGSTPFAKDFGFLWDSTNGIRNLSTFAGTTIKQPYAISDSGYVVASTGSSLALFSVQQRDCPVTPVPQGEPPENPFRYEDLDSVLSERLLNLKASVENAGGAFTPTQQGGGLRSRERQQHLYSIAEKFQSLKKLGMVEGTPFEGIYPQLALPANASAELLACKPCMDDTNEEERMHRIKLPVPGVGVAAPGKSNHEKGLAADVTITGLSEDKIRDLAFDAGLWRPLWEYGGLEAEKHHFEVFHHAPPSLTGIIRGESPINLLVEDPQGRRIGFDSVTGQEVNEIGDSAYYSGRGSEPQIIVVPADSVSLGNYRVSGMGTGDGAYTLRRQLVVDHDPTEIVFDNIFATGLARTGEPLASVVVQLAIPEPSAFVLAGCGLIVALLPQLRYRTVG